MANRIPKMWAVAAITLIALVVVLYMANESFKAAEEATFNEFNKRQLILAKQVNEGIELYFETISHHMRIMAEMPEIQALEETTSMYELQRSFDELQVFGVNDMAIIDANGIVIYNLNAPHLLGVDFSWREYFNEAREMTSSDSYIIEFIEFRGVEEGTLGLIVAVPLFTPENNEFTGVLVATLRIDTLAGKFVAPLDAANGGHAFLVDDRPNLLWAHESALFARTVIEEYPVFQEVINETKAGNSGTLEYSYYKFDKDIGQYLDEEEEKIMAYTPIQLGEEIWTIGVETPKSTVQELIYSIYIKQLPFVLLIIIILIAAFAYVLSFTQQYSKKLEEEVTIKTTELEESRDKIKDYSRTLEDEVEQRTKQLNKKIMELENAKSAMLNILDDSEEARKELKESYKKLKELDKLKAQFLTMTSHELKTPITPVIIQAQMLLDRSLGKLTGEQEESAEIILRNLKRLNKLIGDILDISKIQAAQLRLIPEKAQLEDYIKKIVVDMKPLAEQKNIVLDTEIKVLPQIIFDSQRICQVLANLIGNAVKFTPVKGRILVEAEKQKDNIQVKVKDTGIGIAAKDMYKVFEPFSQLALGYNKKEKGTGLGLSISKGIIEQHGGKIWVKSRPGKGSSFFFTLPLKATKKAKTSGKNKENTKV